MEEERKRSEIELEDLVVERLEERERERDDILLREIEREERREMGFGREREMGVYRGKREGVVVGALRCPPERMKWAEITML